MITEDAARTLITSLILAETDRRSRDLQARLTAWADGYAAAQTASGDAWESGYATAIADIKAVQHDLVRALTGRHALWTVRDSKRTRQTYAQPHTGDYRGGPVPAW